MYDPFLSPGILGLKLESSKFPTDPNQLLLSYGIRIVLA